MPSVKGGGQLLDYFRYISEMEEQNTKFTEEYFSADMQRYELSANVLAGTLNFIDQAFPIQEGRVLQPESKIASVLLASRFLVSAKCLLNMVAQGYYYEAWILMRNLQENAVYCLCFAISNEYARLWFKRRLTIRVALKAARKTIQPSHRKYFKEARDLMDDFVHSKMPAVARFVKFEPKPIMKPQERPEFRKDAKILFSAFRALSTSMLLILVDVFEKDLDKNIRGTITAFVREEQRELALYRSIDRS